MPTLRTAFCAIVATAPRAAWVSASPGCVSARSPLCRPPIRATRLNAESGLAVRQLACDNSLRRESHRRSNGTQTGAGFRPPSSSGVDLTQPSGCVFFVKQAFALMWIGVPPRSAVPPHKAATRDSLLTPLTPVVASYAGLTPRFARCSIRPPWLGVGSSVGRAADF